MNLSQYSLPKALDEARKNLNLLPISACLLLNTHNENYLQNFNYDPTTLFNEIEEIYSTYKKWQKDQKLKNRNPQYGFDLQMFLGVLVSCGSWFDDEKFNSFQKWLFQVTLQNQPENEMQELKKELHQYKQAANQISSGLKTFDILAQNNQKNNSQNDKNINQNNNNINQNNNNINKNNNVNQNDNKNNVNKNDNVNQINNKQKPKKKRNNQKKNNNKKRLQQEQGQGQGQQNQ